MPRWLAQMTTRRSANPFGFGLKGGFKEGFKGGFERSPKPFGFRRRGFKPNLKPFGGGVLNQTRRPARSSALWLKLPLSMIIISN